MNVAGLRVMKKTLTTIAVVLFLLAAACSEEAPAPDRVATDAGTPGNNGHGHGNKDDKKDQKHSKHDRSHDGSDAKDDEHHSGGGGGSRHGGASHDKGSGGGSGSSNDSAAVYPAAGSYDYAQQGYEEFCDASNCDRDDLPATQPVTISYQRRDADSAVVVAEQRASHSRVARTTATFDSDHSLITKVYIHFDYRGVEFENTYEPDPPVEALRFPFQSGASWSGSWDAQTSGSYKIAIGPKQSVEVAGGRVDAYKITTDTQFHGQFEGRSRLTAWIDPQTQAIVKTDGVLNVTSAFGRYSTLFHTQLRSGPGY